MAQARTKVAVLGGGVGGITAAFELTATPELRERFEVTVHQLGWRIGGKGASGRNSALGQRIEEHGLHVWFGFYDNAFRVMREAYEELGRKADAPLATLEDAFEPCDQIVLYDRLATGWHGYAFNAPRNFLEPGAEEGLPTFWDMASTALRWARQRWRELSDEPARAIPRTGALAYRPEWADEAAADVGAEPAAAAAPEDGTELLELAGEVADANAAREGLRAAPAGAPLAAPGKHPGFLVGLVTRFRDWLWDHVVEERADTDPDLRLFFTLLDTLASTVAGIVADDVLDQGFDAINDEEWSAWLARHGAKEVTIGRTPEERAPVLRSVYDVAFGYPGGDIARADVAAGTATNDLLRLLFSYRGSLMYKMQAGMGDAVFTPLYEVLRERGVRFEFFHAVTNLALAQSEPRIDAIEVVRQAQLAGDAYEPLVDVESLPCWPSEPLWEQLEDGRGLREQGVNFELDPNPLAREPTLLERGVDFDEIVLGISIGALPSIAGELIDRDERFGRAIETAVTVQTQAFQVWVTRRPVELGWKHDENSVLGCYVEPLDTYCDMSHLIPRESWGGADVEGIVYFCGVLDERADETPVQATERAKQNAIEFLERDIGTLWPKAGAGGAPFDWQLLAGGDRQIGSDRFDSQYWRANVTGSDRYVLTPAGSVKHRLPSDESGFQNLVLAGDWTKNGIDGGCVEAAVVSGMQAARALIGADRPITGESPRWLRPAP